MSLSPAFRASLLRTLMVLCVAVAAMPLGLPRPAHACSCIAPPETTQALAEAAAVFRGTVVGVAVGEPRQGIMSVDFRVSEVWKGAEPGDLTVTTADNEAACGFGFEQGTEYLVYAHRSGAGALDVSLCSRTVPASGAAADLAALGPGEAEPDGTGPVINDPRPFPTRMAILAGVLVVVVLAVGAWVIIPRIDNGPDPEE